MKGRTRGLQGWFGIYHHLGEIVCLRRSTPLSEVRIMATNEANLDDDDDVPEQAVQALNAASRRAAASGLPLVLVRGDQLVRVDATGVTVLKELPPLKRVTRRTEIRKHA
jgi:hypothetical protein